MLTAWATQASITLHPFPRSTHLAQSVSLGKRLVGSILKLFRHIARPPAVWVVVNFRQSKMEWFLSIRKLFGHTARPPALWVVVNVRQSEMKCVLSGHFATLVDDHVPCFVLQYIPLFPCTFPTSHRPCCFVELNVAYSCKEAETTHGLGSHSPSLKESHAEATVQ